MCDVCPYHNNVWFLCLHFTASHLERRYCFRYAMSWWSVMFPCHHQIMFMPTLHTYTSYLLLEVFFIAEFFTCEQTQLYMHLETNRLDFINWYFSVAVELILRPNEIGLINSNTRLQPVASDSVQYQEVLGSRGHSSREWVSSLCLEWLGEVVFTEEFNTLRPRPNWHHFADDTLKFSWLRMLEFLFEFHCSLFLSPINNIPALVQIMAWCRPGDRPLSEPMMVSLLMHTCITQPQWVKAIHWCWPNVAVYIKNNAWVTMNKDFWSQVSWFANDFHEWRSHEWKSMANHHASDQKIVIWDNECIILFLTCYFMSWTHHSTTHKHPSLISPLSLRMVFSDLTLWRHHSWSVISREHEALAL